MASLAAFPLVDYALRFGPVHQLGSIWDKLVLVCVVLVAAVRYARGYRPPGQQWRRMAVWYVLYCTALFFTGLGDVFIASRGLWIDVYYVVMALVLPFALDARDVRFVFHTGLSVAILIGVHGVYQFVTHAPIPSDWVDAQQHVRTRVYSVLQSPNELGSYMSLMTPMLVGWAILEPHRWRKWLYIGGSVFCLATLVFTFTRGAWMALLLAVIVAAVAFERRLLLPLLVVAVAIAFVPAIGHRLGEFTSSVYWQKAAQSGRLFRWEMAFDKMGANPLTGSGLGRFGGAIATTYFHTPYADNYYAKTLAETGLIGLTLFLSIHVALAREMIARVIQRLQGRPRLAAISMSCGLWAVLFHNSVENVFEFAPMLVSYFLYAILLLAWGADPAEADLSVPATDNWRTRRGGFA